jgi:hypothetical protein
MSDLLAQQVDALVSQLDTASRADQAALSSVPKPFDPDLLARTARAATAARDLSNNVNQLAEGDLAAAVLADRANIQASVKSATAEPASLERRKQTLNRARQEVSASLSSLKINPKDKDATIDAQLRQRVEAAQRLIDAARPVDFPASATRWATALRQSLSTNQPPPGSRMQDRLYAASHAEALRPDADLVAARDFQLAARAVASLSRAVATPPNNLAQSLDQFPKLLAALRLENEVNRKAHQAQTADQAKAIHAAAAQVHRDAAQARAALSALTGDSMSSQTHEDLAMSANAWTATRDFDKAAEADRQLAQQLNKPEIARAADAPRAIDKANTAQEKLADQTTRAADDQSAAIATSQKQVADDLATVEHRRGAAPDSPDSRQRATEAITAAQEKLAALPMQMLNAQQLATSLAEISKRLADAKSQAADAPATRKDMADRAVQQIAEEFEEVQRAFNESLVPFTGKLADDLSESLRPFAPETVKAVSTIEERLKPAATDLQQALHKLSQGEQPPTIETAPQATRDALQEAQDALRAAQSQLVERDPLVTARWFAQQAASALASSPPNKRSATANQKRTLDALNKAAYDALRRSKNTRLSQLPALGQLYLPPASTDWPADSPDAQERQRLINSLPGLREWGRLREQLSDSLTTPTKESNPPAYSEALRTYFEVLNKEESRPATPATNR